MSYAGLILPCQQADCQSARAEQEKLKAAQFDTQFADAAYTNETDRPQIPGYVPITTASELKKAGLMPEDLTIPKTNFRAVVYRNINDNTYVVAFQGTDKFSKTDWGTNVQQCLDIRKNGQPTAYYTHAEDMATRIRAKLGSETDPPPVRFVGHSLGGGLASAAAETSGYPATTFNAAGLNPATVDSPKTTEITAVSVKGEILTTGQTVLPIPQAAASERIKLDPPFDLSRDLLVPAGMSAGGLLLGPAGAATGVSGGILYRSVALHLMPSVHQAMDRAVEVANANVEEKCSGEPHSAW